MTGLTPDIERVLSEHELLEPVEETDVDRCSCGQEFEYASRDQHRAHLAEQIAALVEQREEAAGRALSYIARPTMGLPPGIGAEHHARNIRLAYEAEGCDNGDPVRTALLALETCIRTAQTTLDTLDKLCDQGGAA